MMDKPIQLCISLVATLILSAGQGVSAGELKPAAGEVGLRAGWRVCPVGAAPTETPLRQPKYASRNPLYMTMPIGSGSDAAVTVALDESGGTGKGYDTLHIDANNNGDLTDDQAIKPRINERMGALSFDVEPQQILVRYADGSAIRLTVKLEVRGYESGPDRKIKWTAACHLMEHLEGRLSLGEGKDILIGLFDSSDSAVEANACFTDWGVDRIRLDLNGDGKLDEKGEDFPVSTVIALRGKLWSLVLERGGLAPAAAPYAGPTGRIRFSGKYASGDDVADSVDSYAEVVSANGFALRLTLSGDAGGVVPEGTYRVSRSHLKLRDAKDVLWESFFFTTNFVRVAAGKEASITVGAPLRLEPEVQGTPAPGEHLCIQPYVFGAGGEVYENLSPVSTRMHPTASFTDSEGIVASSGQMEYG